MRALAEIRAEEGELTGLPLRRLTSRLTLDHLAEERGAPVSFDCDTWGTSRRPARGSGSMDMC